MRWRQLAQFQKRNCRQFQFEVTEKTTLQEVESSHLKNRTMNGSKGG